MIPRFVHAMLALILCLSVSLVYGQGRGKESKKPGGEKSAGEGKSERKPEGKPGGESKNEKKPEAKPANEKPGREPAGKPEPKEGAKSAGNNPGGAWSERTHGGKQSGEQAGHEGAKGAAAGEAAEKNKTPQNAGAKGAAAGEAAAKNKSPQATGAEGAAAGAAAEKRKSPEATGAQGAAVGAAAAKRNQPAVSGAQGAAAGAVAAERNAPKASGAAGAATGYAAVRNSFNQPNMYGKQWYGDHPKAWSASGWTSGAAWAAVSWTAVAGYCGYANATPISYHYGDNVTYRDGNVLVDNQSVGTAAEFSQQAADLAQKGVDAQVSDTEDWMALGVFALVRNEHQHPQLILQFAIDKQGILRGNYTDEVSGQTSPILGAVDETTQRAAWTVSGNTKSVMEAGLNNLTESEAPVLIHKNGKTDHWILIRLNNDNGAETDAGK